MSPIRAVNWSRFFRRRTRIYEKKHSAIHFAIWYGVEVFCWFSKTSHPLACVLRTGDRIIYSVRKRLFLKKNWWFIWCLESFPWYTSGKDKSRLNFKIYIYRWMYSKNIATNIVYSNSICYVIELNIVSNKFQSHYWHSSTYIPNLNRLLHIQIFASNQFPLQLLLSKNWST